MNKDAIAAKLAALQVANPKAFLIGATLFTIAAAWTASGLKFDSSYDALLPKDSPEIQNVNEVRDQTGGTRQLVAAVSGGDQKTRDAFADRLAEKLQLLEQVRFVDVAFPVSFFKDRALWLMDEDTLRKLVPALETAVKASKWDANPMNLHLDPEKDKAELEAAWKKVDDLVKSKKDTMPFSERARSKDGKYSFVLLVPEIKFGDVAVGKAFFKRLLDTVDSLNPSREGLQVEFAGNLTIMQEQNITMAKDLRNASILAFAAGILLVAFSLRRAGAPFLIGTALLFGVTWTFAFARLAIGHVNIITGFLVSVIIGLGIDFGIHLFMRVQQNIQFSQMSPDEAVREAVTSTFPPALTSALTTAGTFLSFILADFRGFSEFGLIAGVGVMLTLTSSFLVLPPLLLIFKSKSAAVVPPVAVSSKQPFNRSAAWAIVALFAVGVVYGVLTMGSIEFKNNFRELRGSSDATDFTDYVDKNLGTGFNPSVFVVKSVRDAEKLRNVVLKQQKEGFDGRPSRVGKLLSPSDLIPRNAEKLTPYIADIKKILDDPKLDRAEAQGGKRAEDLRTARKMSSAVPWTIEEIPEVFTRRLMTLDGKEYLVYVWPDVRNDSDIQAATWDDELNALSARISDAGVPHRKADESLVLAWIYKTILADGMPLLSVAAAVVFIFLLFDFRRLRPSLLIAATLACGMSVFLGLVHLTGMSLNMFNIIVLPSIIGIGVDNAVHIYHRYTEEGPGSIRKVIRTTGVAAFLASATTAIGFGAGLISHNVGLQTLGAMAVIGIFSVFSASTVFFSAFLTILEARASKR